MTEQETRPDRRERIPEEDTEEPGSEGDSNSSDTNTPFSPHEDDDSALGDSDQHSDA